MPKHLRCLVSECHPSHQLSLRGIHTSCLWEVTQPFSPRMSFLPCHHWGWYLFPPRPWSHCPCQIPVLLSFSQPWRLLVLGSTDFLTVLRCLLQDQGKSLATCTFYITITSALGSKTVWITLYFSTHHSFCGLPSLNHTEDRQLWKYTSKFCYILLCDD